MTAAKVKTLEVRTRREWREWLRGHHDSEAEVWLVFYKPQASRQSLAYGEALDEALCYGWIDSLVKRLDDQRYARKFTPRKPDSRWSSVNRRRYAELKARGLLAAPGLARAPTQRSGDAPRPSLEAMPEYFTKELKAHPRAWDYFQKLAPSYRRAYIGWVDSAKRQETKRTRLREAVARLAAGKKLGLK